MRSNQGLVCLRSSVGRGKEGERKGEKEQREREMQSLKDRYQKRKLDNEENEIEQNKRMMISVVSRDSIVKMNPNDFEIEKSNNVTLECPHCKIWILKTHKTNNWQCFYCESFFCWKCSLQFLNHNAVRDHIKKEDHYI